VLGGEQPVRHGRCRLPTTERRHNPTGTIGALTYWSAQAITSQYLKSPGPLVAA
jgi:gluconate 2-dehydrogenase alpha chain